MLSTRVILPLVICATLSTAACAPAPSIAPMPAASTGPSSEPSGTHSDEATTRAAVEKLSLDVQNLILSCAETKDSHVQSCVGDALDEYAAGLMQLKDRLAPQLSGLPDIVETAAQRVRAAKTRKQAIQAVRTAIDSVHKSIALLRADDPDILLAQTREGTLVAETLQVADSKLEKAVGL
jgi:hypothetical protein